MQVMNKFQAQAFLALINIKIILLKFKKIVRIKYPYRIIKVVLKDDIRNKIQLDFVKISFYSRPNNLKQNMYVNNSCTCIRSLKFSILFIFRTVRDPASSSRGFFIIIVKAVNVMQGRLRS